MYNRIMAMLYANRGRVYLVGAGPGDPELLTVKAHRLIKQAHLVLHDDLVPEAILSLAGPQAEITSVGKRCGAKKITQAEINARMIESARKGLSVVRLHGGDPAIFGRLAEEIDALEAEDVPYEIVPGITAGTAAAASLGISLTDRRKTSQVIIVSGHRAPKNAPQQATNWRDLARTDATLVIYMPGNDFTELRAELLAAGLPPDTGAVIVSHASEPDQKYCFASLDGLNKVPHMEAPAVLLIGRSLPDAESNLRGHGSRAVDEVEAILSSF
jgi:uroporphyrin-III C-methyltransferase